MLCHQICRGRLQPCSHQLEGSCHRHPSQGGEGRRQPTAVPSPGENAGRQRLPARGPPSLSPTKCDPEENCRSGGGSLHGWSITIAEHPAGWATVCCSLVPPVAPTSFRPLSCCIVPLCHCCGSTQPAPMCLCSSPWWPSQAPLAALQPLLGASSSPWLWCPSCHRGCWSPPVPGELLRQHTGHGASWGPAHCCWDPGRGKNDPFFVLKWRKSSLEFKAPSLQSRAEVTVT